MIGKIKKVLSIALLILALAIMPVVLAACVSKTVIEDSSSDSDASDTDSGLKFVAHRGYSKSHLANTEAAFLAAAERKYFGIETDIRKTKDGYFVCNHDATVIFADGSEKTISTTKLADLISRPLKNDVSNEDAYLCTFEKYLRACKQGDKVAVIELKDWFEQDEIQKILDIVDTEYDRKKVMFISFNFKSLLQVKSEDRKIELQYLSQTKEDSNLDRCLTEKISISYRHDLLTGEMVKTFHKAGLKVNTWTVNERSDLQTVYQKGVDFVTTDVFDEN